jgi:N-acetylglucosamine-6-phosphate deacetylase
MTVLRIANGTIVTGNALLNAADFHFDGGTIDRIAALFEAGTVDIDLEGGWLMPGFIDVQVNGGGGALFNDDTSVEGIRRIGAAHARFGTTAFLPTLISDDPSRIAKALDAADAAIAQGVPGVLGAHIEGPFINPVRKGIHCEEKIRRLDSEMLELLTRPRRGKVVLTLAPELCDLRDIHMLIAAGVIVSVGHSNATYETVRSALFAGVRGFTHLFNAMSPLVHRAPGVVGAALDDDESWCGLIVDRAHLHDAAVRIAVKMRGTDKVMLVTDAMPCVGTDQNVFELQGKTIFVENGTCLNADGTLAGSALDMASALRNVIEIAGLVPQEAAVMASETPAAFLGLDDQRGTLAPGKRADWVWLDRNLRPRGTWIGGQLQ